jgi:type II restriction enzyme
MTPAQPWTGEFKQPRIYYRERDGEIICYHIYNHNEFQEYLFRNTRLKHQAPVGTNSEQFIQKMVKII